MPCLTVDEFRSTVNTRSLFEVLVALVDCVGVAKVVGLLEVAVVPVVLKVPFR